MFLLNFLGNKKVAAIGIRVSRWISYHGLAVNVTTDLSPFQRIVPCGLQDREVCSVKELLGNSLSGKIEDSVLIDTAHESLVKEFSEVFQLSLSDRSIS